MVQKKNQRVQTHQFVRSYFVITLTGKLAAIVKQNSMAVPLLH
jgi:hypothetical protein